MKILVPITMVPDLVEELEIDDSGAALDMTWGQWIINEFDDHAIEQAILLKEAFGGEVTVLALDGEGVDDVLFAAAAKGADQLVKLVGAPEEGLGSQDKARIYANAIKSTPCDLVLTGVQAHDDIDGNLGPILAELLDYAYTGYVAGVRLDGDKAVINKEYPGGIIAEMEVSTPAVLGIQASEQPPRYIAFSKIRQAMGSSEIIENDALDIPPSGGALVSKMYLPEEAGSAEMIEGGISDVTARLLEILREHQVVG